MGAKMDPLSTTAIEGFLPDGPIWLDGGVPDSALALGHLERRLDAAAAELALDEEQRLTELQRAQMRALHQALVRSIEADLRLRLARRLERDDAPEELLAALDAAHVEIALPLIRLPGKGDLALVELLLRRVDAHRLALALGQDTHRAAGVVQQLLDLADPAIAEATMAMMIADSRSRDAFGEPQLDGVDLPEILRRRLVWKIAAALRTYMVRRHGMRAERADAHVTAIGGAYLAEHQPVPGVEAAAATLVALLDEREMLDDELIMQALEDGLLPLFAAGLALRGAIDGATVWAMVADPSAWMVATLLKAIGCQREPAVTMLWRLGLAHGTAEDRLIERSEAFDALNEGRAHDALGIWRSDRAYRRGVAELGERDYLP
ncbi:DUF2336 domain-containing protein [Sphingomonas montanisoli]|uniref:DUF2336 domain-containing protein n=1 Tax=Sphingomonas montanisoli TaxID=2606412 RepID=A0A5D9C7V3_9SPHN|nr:DUF2336 domain-containing protein [Sphingomonas montanisoli]